MRRAFRHWLDPRLPQPPRLAPVPLSTLWHAPSGRVWTLAERKRAAEGIMREIDSLCYEDRMLAHTYGIQRARAHHFDERLLRHYYPDVETRDLHQSQAQDL